MDPNSSTLKTFDGHNTRTCRGDASQGRGRGHDGWIRRGWTPKSPGRGAWKRQWKPEPTPTTPEPPLGRLLSSLAMTDFSTAAEALESKARIINCKVVASYNWLDRSAPTILVPGKPPKWTPLVQARQLQPDSGEYFRCLNSASFPKHPIEPTVRATLAMQPKIAPQIDVVACGSTIGNLLRFIRGEDKKFRMLVESVGTTVFFIRRENTPRELIPNVKGFGHTFPEEYTTWQEDVRGSKSHQRVLSYQFGGLRFLLRHSGDGYIAPQDTDKPADAHIPFLTTPGLVNLDVNAALNQLSSELLNHRVASRPIASDGEAELRVECAGDLVAQDFIFELKTRSIRRKTGLVTEDIFSDQLPRLWVAQIPRLILAYHKGGRFEDEDIEVLDTREKVKAWEQDNVGDLSRLAALIHHIVDLAPSQLDLKLELRHDAVGVLEVREQLKDAGSALSAEINGMWQQQQGLGVSNTSSSPEGSVGQHRFVKEDHLDDSDWDKESEQSERDYTACSAENCGYCGKCSY